MPETKVIISNYEGADGSERTQYRSTIPKGLAEAYNMDTDTKLKWTAETGNKMTVEVVHD